MNDHFEIFNKRCRRQKPALCQTAHPELRALQQNKVSVVERNLGVAFEAKVSWKRNDDALKLSDNVVCATIIANTSYFHPSTI